MLYKCVNDVFSFRQKQAFRSLPVKDRKYTLKEIVHSSIDGKEGFVFEELPNPRHDNGQEYSFRPSRFIPMDDITVSSILGENKLQNT